jgi:hypothetical protein
MVTYTLWLLLHTSGGEYISLQGKEYKTAEQCLAVAEGLKGRPISNAVVLVATCKEHTDA